MKQYKITLSIIIFLIIGQYAVSAETSKLDSIVNAYYKKQADNAYRKLAYVKAIKLYNKIIDNEFADANIYSNLADANYKIGETVKSEELYKLLINNYEYKSIDLYRYAQALKYNGNYQESDVWMEKYIELNPEDSRAQRQLESSKTVNELKSIKRYKVENVDFNSKYADFGPALRGDKLYFSSERKVDEIINYEYAWKESPYHDIYEVNLEGVVTKPKLLEGRVNSKFHDGPVCFSDDESEMFFTRNNSYFRIISKNGEGKVNNLKIYKTKIINNEVSEPVELPFNSKDYSSGHPSLTKDGKVLYFSSNMPGGFGEADIYMVERTATGWSEPKNLGPEINTEGNEMFPFIHGSGILYFSSNGHSGIGGLDIYKAELHGGKYQIENMGYPLNSSSDDFSLIIDDNEKSGYFASNREGGKGDDDIYKFDVLDVSLFLHVRVFDKNSGNRIVNPKIYFNEKVVIKSEENSNTEVDFKKKVLPKEVHSFSVTKSGYLSFDASINIKELKKEGNIVSYDVYLTPEPEWGIYGKVFYKETLEEIPEVNIHLENASTGFVKKYISDSSGLFRIQLEKETDYKLRFEKDDIFAIRTEYSTVGRDSGWVNINEFVELAFEKIELNKKIEIPNIYYDLSKWNIREDAAIELDKVVQFLLDNPKIQIELGSHTDARGSKSSNQILSQKRAESAVNYIVEHGIARNRITAKGYGESRLKNHCADGVQCSKEEHQANRRTEIRITDF